MTSDDNRSGLGGLAVAGVGLLMVLCCAGPVLIAGGSLGALGGVVRSPWLIAAGAVVVLAALGYTIRRRANRDRSGGDRRDCCPPQLPAHHQAQETVRPPAWHAHPRKP